MESTTPFIHIRIQEAVHTYSGRKRTNAAIGPVSLDIRSKEFFSVIGPPGCGKTTFLRMVAGLIAPTQGKIETRGQNANDLGIAFANPTLLPWRTVLENILLQAELRHLNLDQCTERARALIAALGLSGFESKKPAELNPGLAQRVALCRALIHNPKLLILDNIFAALEPLTREPITTELQRYWINNSLTVLFATSHIEEAVLLSDRIAVMSPITHQIVEIIEIELPRPRRFDKYQTPAILEYSNGIRTIFHAQGLL